MMQGTREWYVYDDSVVKGPYPSRMMSDWYTRGQLRDDHEVRIGPKGVFTPVKFLLSSGKNNDADDMMQEESVNPFEPNGIEALKDARRYLRELVSFKKQ